MIQLTSIKVKKDYKLLDRIEKIINKKDGK